MGAPAIVWFEDFQLTQNAGGRLPDRFQNGNRYTSLVGLTTSAGSSVPNGANGCSQPILLKNSQAGRCCHKLEQAFCERTSGKQHSQGGVPAGQCSDEMPSLGQIPSFSTQ